MLSHAETYHGTFATASYGERRRFDLGFSLVGTLKPLQPSSKCWTTIRLVGASS